MNKENWTLWSNITFKTQSYRKNFDLINQNENFITEYEGTISEIRIDKHLPPRQIGEYCFSIWNIGLGDEFGVDFDKLIKDHELEDTYNELINVIKKNKINVNDYKKILLIHNFVLNDDYRKQEISDEFIEMIYRDYYSDDIAIIMLVKPFQDNLTDADHYLNYRRVIIKNSLNVEDDTNVSAMDYYSLLELTNKTDTELNEYKLFAIANRCGFQRINESYLFLFSPEKIDERLTLKQKYLQKIETE